MISTSSSSIVPSSTKKLRNRVRSSLKVTITSLARPITTLPTSVADGYGSGRRMGMIVSQIVEVLIEYLVHDPKLIPRVHKIFDRTVQGVLRLVDAGHGVVCSGQDSARFLRSDRARVIENSLRGPFGNTQQDRPSALNPDGARPISVTA